MNLHEAQKKTVAVIEEAEKRIRKKMDLKERFIALVEEVGELANSILIDNKNKPENRRRAEFKDSICDILFDLFALAEINGMDLTSEYEKMLEQMKERIKRGDFNG